MSFRTAVKVRFGDIDHAGLAYYPNLYHYFHIAFEEFFEHCIGIPYPDVLDKEGTGFPTVKVETRFLSPIRYGDTLDIDIRVLRMGNSSIDILFHATRAADGTVCIESRQTVVAVDMSTFRPIRLTDRYRELFARAQ